LQLIKRSLAANKFKNFSNSRDASPTKKCLTNKKSGVIAAFFLFSPLSPTLPVRLKTFRTVYRFAAVWLEGHGGLFTAVRANHRKHLTRPAALRLARRAAGRATAGFVLETLFGEEFLLRGGKEKFAAAVPAGQSFVREHRKTSTFLLPVRWGYLNFPLKLGRSEDYQCTII
jgi:hypothetical protein